MSITTSSMPDPNLPPEPAPARRSRLGRRARAAVTVLAVPFLSGVAYQIGTVVVDWLTS